MRTVLSALALIAATTLALPTASADEDRGYDKADWPLKLIKRPLVLAPKMLELRGDTLRVNLSKGKASKPISLAPDLFFGINSKWTVGLTHDTGICLTGTDGGCPKPYNDLGLELQFSLMGRGSLQLAAVGGVTSPSLSSPTVAGLKFGFLARLRAGKVAMVTRPNLYIGVNKRSVYGDIAEIPVDIQFQLNAQTAVAVESGISGSLDDFGGDNEIPLGLSALFAVSEKIDFGVAARFNNVAGSDGGVDDREFLGRFALRL